MSISYWDAKNRETNIEITAKGPPRSFLSTNDKKLTSRCQDKKTNHFSEYEKPKGLTQWEKATWINAAKTELENKDKIISEATAPPIQTDSEEFKGIKDKEVQDYLNILGIGYTLWIGRN